MKQHTRLTPAIAALGLLITLVPVVRADSDVGFSMRLQNFSIYGEANITLVNTGRVEITDFELTVGHDAAFGFDAARFISGSDFASPPSPPTMVVNAPDEDNGGTTTQPRLWLEFTDFDPGDSITFYIDIDQATGGGGGGNARTVLFNNGAQPNAVASVTRKAKGPDGNDETINLTLPDGPAFGDAYFFTSGLQGRDLKVKSLVEAANDPASGGVPVFVDEASVRINGKIPTEVSFTEPGAGTPSADDIGREILVRVFDGDQIELTAPSVAYRDLRGGKLSDIALADPQQLREQAEERFRAIGISVNDDPQTGDPTLYEFEIDGSDVEVVLKWQHEYALRIESSFAGTASIERDGNNDPWAGPLSSQATGNPSPDAGSVHWIGRNQQVSTFIDSSYVDQFQHPGLSIRYVPYAYVAYGPPNTDLTSDVNESARTNSNVVPLLLAARANSPDDAFVTPPTITPSGIALRKVYPFTVGQSPEPRYQIGSFTMYGPGEVRYLWKIQFGVDVSVDDPSRDGVPQIVAPDGLDRSSPGTYWFDQDVPVTVAAKAKDSEGADANALTGWIAGDGYYFASRGQIDAGDGSLTLGEPLVLDNGNAVATWNPAPANLSGYRALEIPRLRRPAKVLWSYGNGLIRTVVTVGEFAFQKNPDLARIFNTEPTVRTSPAPTNTDLPVQGVWDPEAAKFYPLAGGSGGTSNVFRVDWVPAGDTQAMEVEIKVLWPQPAHYPHVVGAPAVALDPDPDDDWLFKELKYSENDASVDDKNLFIAPEAGRSVLLFSNIQGQGRGQPREFLQVRVVETKSLNDATTGSANPTEVVIGEKIRDLVLDRARLGTGYVVGSDSETNPTRARYNPLIYDPAKLIGIGAKDVYDTDLLFSDSGAKQIANKSALPGPIIPVNLHPGAVSADLLRVIWYDDPAQNDGLIWPHAGRIYQPRWPSEGTFEAQLLGEAIDGGGDTFGRVFELLAGASGIALDGQLAFVAAAGDDALVVIDITDPSTPRLVSEASAMTGNFTHLGGALDVVVADGLAFVAAPGDHAVTVIDVSNPVRPRALSKIVDGEAGFDSLEGASSLAVSGDLLAVGAGIDGAITLVDISVPASPRRLASLSTGLGGVSALAMNGGVLYATVATAGKLALFDISDPAAPTPLSDIAGLSNGEYLIVSNGKVFVAQGDAVSVVSVLDPLAPELLATVPASASALALDGDLLYTASPTGSTVLDVGEPQSAASIKTLGTLGDLGLLGLTDPGLAVSEGLLLMTGTGPAEIATFAVRADRLGRIVIATQWGSESEDAVGNDQLVAQASGTFPRATTYDPSRMQQVSVYSQPDRTAPGYNPNEEHALMAPSLRNAQVSPRPSAAYALRDNDLNVYPGSRLPMNARGGSSYTSDPFVLVQFFDVAEEEFKMNVYTVRADDANASGSAFEANYTFADIPVAPTANRLKNEPFVRMEAGEPVIPFYPIGFVDGAVPCPQTYGTDLLSQNTYWEDHRGSNWAISGGDMAWFATSPYYRMSPSFWWPDTGGSDTQPRIGTLIESRRDSTTNFGGVSVPVVLADQKAAPVFTGDCVSFLPSDVTSLFSVAEDAVVRTTAILRRDSVVVNDVVTPIPESIAQSLSSITSAAQQNLPTEILYKSDWPTIAPVLKAGETLTFSGGEYRADNPTTTVFDPQDGLLTIDTPGLPQLTAFATAEVVFDSLNPEGVAGTYKTSWTARVAQVLDVRRLELPIEDFPGVLQPANGKTRVVNGKFLFVDLPASLQKRVRYNPLSQFKDAAGVTRTGKLEVIGLLNDKDIGDATLTASPPAVYVLEPNILTDDDVTALQALDGEANSTWDDKISALQKLARNPNGLTPPSNNPSPYYVGLEGKVDRDSITGEALRERIEPGSEVLVPIKMPGVAAPVRAFGPGLALLPNGDFLDPNGNLPGSTEPYPDVSWVAVVENNDPSLGGSPITPHVIKIDRRERYRGSIKTIESDNVFDENLVLRHTGDFGANVDDLVFEWWYRPDDGSTDVAPPDLVPSSQPFPWKVFPDDTGARGLGRNVITLKGNPNAPEALIADTFWFVRYRHKDDVVNDTDWGITRPVGTGDPPYTWAGAGNSQPFEDFNNDLIPDFRAQLAQGWIKRVLDAVNPYEARIRDFNGDNPATVTSMIQQFGARFEGPVALNPAKNVIENVGLIELYETILKRGRDLTIDLSRPVASPAIANALQLASTRISDFYTLLGNEAYVDALDPTVGIEDGQLPPTVFTFQNQMSSRIGEELALLRGVDDFFARPVYNRLFWNFTKGEGEAAYALNYNISDINTDGFVNEDDAMILYPQGHGDAWGHYLTALRNQYELLAHRNFNWVSRSEFYNLQDIVIKVDFLDERKFAATAAAKAKAGAEIVDQTYRERYVGDPEAQWQGYTDSDKDRAWGVQGWARRAGQGAYFDWVTANALLPSEHPNETLEGIQKVDRRSNSDIKVISANLNSIQRTFDEANEGSNPLGVLRDAVTFDIDPTFIEVGSGIQGELHFEQIYQRAVAALESADAVWQNANEVRNRLRSVATSEQEFREATFQEDLAYRNQLIRIFGKPYEGSVGPGQLYPAGYEGPDLALYMYVNVREITKDTVPGPTATFATFNDLGELIRTPIPLPGADPNDPASLDPDIRNGSLFEAVRNNTGGRGGEDYEIEEILDEGYARIFTPTFASASNGVNSGLFAVNYTDLTDPKVPLEGLAQTFPIKAAGYTFQAPDAWGGRPATGELQILINQMVQQEAAIAAAIGAWDGLQGGIVREARIISARLDSSASIRQRNKEFLATKFVFDSIIQGLELANEINDTAEELVFDIAKSAVTGIPGNLPIGGLAVSPGDALSAARSGIEIGKTGALGALKSTGTIVKIAKLVEELAFGAAELGVNFSNEDDELTLNKKEWLKGLEDLAGDEPVLRIAVFQEIQALRELSDQYRSLLDEGIRLIDERQAFNKRVAAQTQLQRYQDMTFRVSRNAALQAYRGAFDLAARYAYMAGKAYDYETNFAPGDPGSPAGVLQSIVSARGLGQVDDGPQLGQGGIAGALATLKANFESQRGQLGINNPQLETGKMSLRTEMMRILPKDNGGPADAAWRQALQEGSVPDLWDVPEFRYHCRPFVSATNAEGERVPQPGIVLRFGTEITAGNNFFGHPLGGGDQAYDASSYATKILGAGIWFSDYASDDLFGDLAEAPRVYLVPVGADIMNIPTAGASPSANDPNFQRLWNVIDASIPVPIPATASDLDTGAWVPLLDGLNGRIGEPRKFASFRAYHNGIADIDDDQLVFDSRLVGRSVWNTEWVLIIPGLTLNADGQVGIERLIDQVSDIKLVFQTYGYRGS